MHYSVLTAMCCTFAIPNGNRFATRIPDLMDTTLPMPPQGFVCGMYHRQGSTLIIGQPDHNLARRLAEKRA